MKRKDIAAGAALLAALSDPLTMAKAMVELEQKHAEASDKISELDDKAKDMAVREAALNALMEDQKLREKSLNEREASLAAQEVEVKQHIDAQWTAYFATRDTQNKMVTDRSEELNLRENGLNEQARKIVQERLAIDQFADKLKEREEALAAREEKWQADHKELLITKAKLKELIS